MGGSVYSSSYSRGYSGGGYSPWSYSEQSSRRERPRLRHTLEKEGFSKKEIYVLPEKPKQEINQDKSATIIDVDFVDAEPTKKSISEFPEKSELNCEKLKLACERAKLDCEREKLKLEQQKLAKEREEFEQQKRRKRNRLFELIIRFISRARQEER